MNEAPDPVDAPLQAIPGDAQAGGCVDRFVPPSLQPYLRLARIDRPIGWWLLLFPCWWGAALAADGTLPSAWPLLLFLIGAIAMRGAGCTVNDLADRDIDRMVARTRGRPLASGTLSARQALAFLALQLAVGLAVLLQFNGTTILLGFAVMPLVLAYPFMKRVTWWPQLFLGLTFNWGALVGWAAVRGALDAPAILLYLAGIAWTLGYDTVYAHQDKEDDALIGVRSSALRLGRATVPFLFVAYGVTLALMAGAGERAGLHPAFFAGLALAGAQLAWQALTVRTDDPADCLEKFKSNRWFGWSVLAAIVAGQLGNAI
ncbi:MAG: 4-hydroxybenzoate octaprenyltransferase [Acetobacterales bacterium]